jgi:hypothetical protein
VARDRLDVEPIGVVDPAFDLRDADDQRAALRAGELRRVVANVPKAEGV